MGAVVLLLGLLCGALGLGTATSCPVPCTCGEGANAGKVNCSALNLTTPPQQDGDPSPYVTLDLGKNNLTVLGEGAFRNFSGVHEILLSQNKIRLIHSGAFQGLKLIRMIFIDDNNLDIFPLEALRSLTTLENIRLSGNRLRSVCDECLAPFGQLRRLNLDSNWLGEVPKQALTTVTNLEVLTLSNNKIQVLRNGTFQNLTQLLILVLKQNLIERVEEEAFLGLYALKVLEINSNRLQVLPTSLAHLPSLKELSFSHNNIRELRDDTFAHNPQLYAVDMAGNPLVSVGLTTFAHLPALKTLSLSEVRHLWEFPDLEDDHSLEHLRLDRGALRAISPDLCNDVPRIKSLNLQSNQIEALPNLTACLQLRLIDLSYNQLRTLEGSPFKYQTRLIDLFLSNNAVDSIPEDSFLGLESLHVLDLNNNRISWIHGEAFVPMKELRELNLGANQFSRLPPKGLQNLRKLKTYGNANLKDFPAPESFPRIQSLALSYAYHCCAFLPLVQRATAKPATMQETIVWIHKDQVDLTIWKTNFTDSWPGFDNFSSKFEEFANDWWHNVGRDYTIPDNIAQYAEEYNDDYKPVYNSEEALLSRHPISCLPEPGPFMPCEDLFGWWTLRCGVWVVFLLALLGNGVVVVVLLFGRSKMDVPRFLVCNLAMADFFMGVYLGILAVVDASTLGEFKVYAIQWQFSAGCQIAGFLGVLSTELSVYTLSVITLERNYAITHAMHLNKRLSLKHAAYIMSTAWIFALVMSFLPLFGVSDYRKFAVCLPFEVQEAGSLAYVVFLILINGVAFLILMGCYLKMYCAIRGSQAWNSNDSRIAKRMALLVFTDFVCWAPIAFFALTAVFGLHLISLEEAKVFTIFVLPLNSCANPFLYAIFTKQFKKDCVLICKRIEESRVTRGIGRCRHSSNFSNRHTPANTNSAADKKSGSEPTQCLCSSTKSEPRRTLLRSRKGWKTLALRYLLCRDRSDSDRNGAGHHHHTGTSSSASDYAYALAQIQKGIHGDTKKSGSRGHKRASSISSENFSSRSDSWRQGHVPLRLLERAAHRRNSWSVTRKQSQDSNLSCSRQDSSTSTYRMSRSSVSSSDNAGNSVGGVTTRVGSLIRNNTQGNAASGAPVTNSGGTSLMARGLLSSSVKDKPKLCRQSAVDDSRGAVTTVALQQHPPSQNRAGGAGAGAVEIRAFTPRSPPSLVGRPAELCPACARKEASPPLTFKSKEMEEKFTCFYNRLAETSHEESSEVSTSKEEPALLSTSSADQKDSKGTHESTVSTGDERAPTPPPSPPPPATKPQARTSRHSDAFLSTLRPTPVDLRASDEAIRREPQEPEEPRKCHSQTSIQKLSLKSLPAALLSSFAAVAPKLKVRSHSQLRPNSVEQLPTSRSETTLIHPLHFHSQECVHADWTRNSRGRSFAAVGSLAEDADSSSSEPDDVFTRKQDGGQDILLHPQVRRAQDQDSLRTRTSEDAPLISGDQG